MTLQNKAPSRLIKQRKETRLLEQSSCTSAVPCYLIDQHPEIVQRIAALPDAFRAQK